METEKEIVKIDAAGQTLGRFAVRVAGILRGKNKPSFDHSREGFIVVVVRHAEHIKVSGKKFDQKEYFHHTGYPGGGKIVPFRRVFERSPREVIRKAVFGMLPKNRLRAKQIRRLKFE